MVAADDPLDTYLVHHPEALFDRPVEATVLDPQNPYVLAPHLAAAAAELPLTDVDVDVFGPTMPALVEVLVARGLLRRRPGGWYWTHADRATDHVVAARVRGGGAHRRAPDRHGCSAPSTGPPPTAASTPVRSTCTRGRPTSSTELDLDDAARPGDAR